MKSHRILIVDDHNEIRRLLRFTFQTTGHRIYEAANGQDALRLARRKRPDLVLLDVMMPGGLDGFEVCRHLKGDPLMAETKVLLLTARGQAGDFLAGHGAGADGYLVKPFSPLALIDLAENLLAASR